MLTSCEHSAAPEVLQSFTELVERSSVVPEVAPEEPAAEARLAGWVLRGQGRGAALAGSRSGSARCGLLRSLGRQDVAAAWSEMTFAWNLGATAGYRQLQLFFAEDGKVWPPDSAWLVFVI